MFKERMLVLVAVGLAATVASADVVQEMTPELIREAIKDRKSDGCYRLGKGIGMTPLGCFTTPYSRVVQAAQDAVKHYKPFTEANVTPEMLTPEVRVHGFSRAHPKGPGVSSVEAIVVMPRGAKDRAAAIQPTKTEELTSEYKNLLGATFEGKSMTATFPLSILSEENEVRFVFDGPACVGMMAPKTECGADSKLDKVR